MLLISSQVQAQKTLKHGLYIGISAKSMNADVSGKHLDKNGSAQNATINNSKVSKVHSFGYNIRYMPKVGFGYESGLYFTQISAPSQNVTLMHDDGTAFKDGSDQDYVVASPSSYLSTTDLYLGGLYNFAKINQVTPYVGVGYAKVKGNWYKSYYQRGGLESEYGTKGKTKINGHYISAKIGINFMNNYNIELEHAKHKINADAFRSFNINGSDVKFSRTSINLISNF